MFLLMRSRLYLALCSTLIFSSLLYLMVFRAFQQPIHFSPQPTTEGCTQCKDIVNSYTREQNNNLEVLSPNMVRINKSLFFIQASYRSKQLLDLNLMQACSIESAAIHNPHLDIYLLFPTPINEKLGRNIFIKVIESYRNVKLRHITMNTFFEDTPLVELWRKNRAGLTFDNNLPLESHATDFLKYTLLWKYGGYFMDLDFILFRPFDKMMNFAGAESVTTVSAGVLSMTHGSQVADMCMEDIASHLRKKDWDKKMGPYVITRVLKKLCHMDKVKDMYGAKCEGFSILKPQSLYPVNFEEWYIYYITENATGVMAKLNNSLGVFGGTILSKRSQFVKHSDQPYFQLANKFCPKLYYSIILNEVNV